MNRLLKPFLKLPGRFNQIRKSLNKDKYKTVNLYFQDESRFGLMTHVGRCITARGVKPIATYRHAFKNTYLYGAFSPIDGDSVIFDIPCVSSEAFYKYMVALSEHRPSEFKVVVIDNAGFHSLQKYTLPDNICLVRIPPYSPELNPCEKIWAYIKQRFKNRVFDSIQQVRQWLDDFICNSINADTVKAITHNQKYMNAVKAHLQI